jgi:hypothetical protein
MLGVDLTVVLRPRDFQGPVPALFKLYDFVELSLAECEIASEGDRLEATDPAREPHMDRALSRKVISGLTS